MAYSKRNLKTGFYALLKSMVKILSAIFLHRAGLATLLISPEDVFGKMKVSQKVSKKLAPQMA